MKECRALLEGRQTEHLGGTTCYQLLVKGGRVLAAKTVRSKLLTHIYYGLDEVIEAQVARFFTRVAYSGVANNNRLHATFIFKPEQASLPIYKPDRAFGEWVLRVLRL